MLVKQSTYHIRPNFRGAQSSRIANFKHFTETIFVDQEFQEFQLYGILKFRELNFRGLLGIHKNREIYASQKSGHFMVYAFGLYMCCSSSLF